jgi:hypothetical protein
MVFGLTTVIVAWVQRDGFTSEPLGTVFLFAVVYSCMAWVLWRPFRLRVADIVEEKGDGLSICRGNVSVHVPYSDVQSLEVLKIGTAFGAKLAFSKGNSLGSEIGFFLNDPPDGSHGVDPVEYLQSKIGDACRMPPNTSLERTREG